MLGLPQLQLLLVPRQPLLYTMNQAACFRRFADGNMRGIQKQLQLWQAKHDAESAAASFSSKHAALEKQVGALKQQSNQRPDVAQGQSSGSREESAALVKTTRRRAADEKAMTILGK